MSCLKSVLKTGALFLKNNNIEEYVVDSAILLCHILKCDKTFLYTNPNLKINCNQQNKFNELLNRRAKFEPLQYITGQQEFMGINFKVNPHTLIPRQDTEILVESVLDHICKVNQPNINILDIGTGSGCIAICLAYFAPTCTVTASDISHHAIETAKQNARDIGVQNRIDFILNDIFENINSTRKFDIIVSNPPYIPTKDIASLQSEVKNYEPIIALDGESDGLKFYKHIISNSPRYLNSHGLLALEIGYNQAESVLELMKLDFSSARVIKDLSRNDRVVLGTFDCCPNVIKLSRNRL